jgi:pyrimidine deaminase RibD-like protein
MDSQQDREFMEEAIKWANGCQPIKESIPKVGAVIAVGQNVIGRGRRGTGEEGDDLHAEEVAIESVKDKSLLAQATLYTDLNASILKPPQALARNSLVRVQYAHEHPLDSLTISRRKFESRTKPSSVFKRDFTPPSSGQKPGTCSELTKAAESTRFASHA